MIVLKSIFLAGLSFLFLTLIFSPLERLFPLEKGQKLFRKKWVLDMCFFFGQYLIWGSLVLGAVYYLNTLIAGIIPDQIILAISKQPTWLKVIEVFVLSDLFIYWGHRLQHKVDFLWRFHKVHHSAEELDWLAAHREHPLDSIYTIGLINLPLFIIGFPLEIIAGMVAFRGIWAIYIHSNVKLPLGVFKYLLGSPEIHHWHHDLERDRGNYANLSPLMDLLFGTFTLPENTPRQYGIRENIPGTYLGQLIEPVIPGNLKAVKWLRAMVIFGIAYITYLILM